MNEQMPGEPKKNNTILYVAIGAVVLCCCCATIFGLWTYGDAIMQALGG